jgi:hypothetical protein
MSGAVALEEAALLADRQRCDALLSADVATLSGLVDDVLSYTHSSGRHDTRESYLDGVGSGRTVYYAIERERVSARALDGAVLVEGVARLEVTIDGVAKHLRNHYLAVWRSHQGRLRLCAWASTALA